MNNNVNFSLTLLISIFFLLGNTYSLFAQSLTIQEQLTWKTNEIQLKEKVGNCPLPVKGFWDLENDVPKIYFNYKVKGNQGEFVVSAIQVEPITADAPCFSTETIGNDFKFEVLFPSDRKRNYLLLSLVPVRYNSSAGQYEKLVSFLGTIHYSHKNNSYNKAFAQNSVFQNGSGDWYKIGVTKNGIYKIDYNYLKDLGIDIDNISPNSINIYGNGFGMLPENNNEYRPDDVLKNAIYVKGENDGKFDPEDYILFYGRDAHQIKNDNNKFTHQINLYCDTSYYFININPSGTAKRIGSAPLSTNATTHSITEFNDFQYIEDEKFNLGKGGREWYGDLFDVQTTYSYNFAFPNIVSSDSIRVRIRTLISSISTSPYYTVSNSFSSYQLPNLTTPSGNGTYSPYARAQIKEFKLKQNSDHTSLSVTFNKSGIPSSKGWLDFIEINARRQLIMSGEQMAFRDLSSVGNGNVAEFFLNEQHPVDHIWEITSPTSVQSVDFTRSGNLLSFKINSDSLREFIAFKNDNFLTPVFFQKIEYQNLHALPYADMIIISAPQFLSASTDLANFHQSEGLSVHTVTTEQVFNEFSSGMRDATAIKTFLRMFYKRAGNNPSTIPKYCLLMGDGSYDNRNLMKHNKNFIPTYESKETLSKTSSYTSDDYFAILADNAGMNATDLLDVAIGRLPVKTLQEANDMVRKVKIYSDPTVAQTLAPDHCSNTKDASILKDWRNQTVQMSDDQDNNHYFNDIEIMCAKIELLHPEINIIKIHADSYKETTSAGGNRNYGAQEALKENVQKGALLVNYIGHGGEVGLGHERYLDVPTIKAWTNLLALPVFMTATCEFSRFDDHDRTSAGEYVILNPNGGAIGMFTTVRLVYSSSNTLLNSIFYDTVFDKLNGLPQRFGDIYKGTKNKYGISNGDVNYRKFALLGDPAVRLAMPTYQIETDSINGISVQADLDTLSALSKVSIKGHIEDNSNQLMNQFNGTVSVKVFDKKAQLRTLANNSDSYVADFTMWKNLIYKGKATVKNGAFSIEFIVPKDIALNYGNGRISYYAQNGVIDANGYNEQAIIGGIDTTAQADNEPPMISLYMNNEKFVSGGTTDENPSLYAKVFDKNGINTVGNGIGHNIEAVLDRNTTKSILLNDYYESDLDTYKSGKIVYPFSKLKEGNHTLSLKVWDVYNNSNKEEIEFIVAKNEKIALTHILNYPNPFTTKTDFSFEHNQVCDFLDVQIQIFTISGKLVKTINRRVTSNGYRIDGITWNGTDDFGDKIGRGVYVYKVKIVNESGEKAEKYEKLVILN